MSFTALVAIIILTIAIGIFVLNMYTEKRSLSHRESHIYRSVVIGSSSVILATIAWVFGMYTWWRDEVAESLFLVFQCILPIVCIFVLCYFVWKKATGALWLLFSQFVILCVSGLLYLITSM